MRRLDGPTDGTIIYEKNLYLDIFFITLVTWYSFWGFQFFPQGSSIRANVPNAYFLSFFLNFLMPVCLVYCLFKFVQCILFANFYETGFVSRPRNFDDVPHLKFFCASITGDCSRSKTGGVTAVTGDWTWRFCMMKKVMI